jgi:hypothetical protein
VFGFFSRGTTGFLKKSTCAVLSWIGMLNCCNGSWLARTLFREGKRESFFCWSIAGSSYFFFSFMRVCLAADGDPDLYTMMEFEPELDSL